MVRYPKTRVSRMVTMLLTQSRLLRRVRNKSYLASFWHDMDRGDHRGISNRCHSMPGERAWCVDWGRGRMAFPLFAGENKKTVCSCKIRTHCFFGTPGGTRTPNPQNRKQRELPLYFLLFQRVYANISFFSTVFSTCMVSLIPPEKVLLDNMNPGKLRSGRTENKTIKSFHALAV